MGSEMCIRDSPPVKDVYLVMKVVQRNAREAAGLPSLTSRVQGPIS